MSYQLRVVRYALNTMMLVERLTSMRSWQGSAGGNAAEARPIANTKRRTDAKRMIESGRSYLITMLGAKIYIRFFLTSLPSQGVL